MHGDLRTTQVWMVQRATWPIYSRPG